MRLCWIWVRVRATVARFQQSYLVQVKIAWTPLMGLETRRRKGIVWVKVIQRNNWFLSPRRDAEKNKNKRAKARHWMKWYTPIVVLHVRKYMYISRYIMYILFKTVNIYFDPGIVQFSSNIITFDAAVLLIL